MRIAPDSAEVHHAYGLVQVRLKHNEAALAALKRASELAPETARFAHVYGVALNSFGDADRAVASLEDTQRRHPRDPDGLKALIAILRENGRLNEAAGYALELKAL